MRTYEERVLAGEGENITPEELKKFGISEEHHSTNKWRAGCRQALLDVMEAAEPLFKESAELRAIGVEKREVSFWERPIPEGCSIRQLHELLCEYGNRDNPKTAPSEKIRAREIHKEASRMVAEAKADCVKAGVARFGCTDPTKPEDFNWAHLEDEPVPVGDRPIGGLAGTGGEVQMLR
ncbi:MAG: hypothetical protein ACYTG0_37700 [Planctomycetota bacterium]|jgi:hypothetical protein